MKVPLTSEVGTPKASARFWRTAWLSVSFDGTVAPLPPVCSEVWLVAPWEG